MLGIALYALAGLLSWTLLEYAIHAWVGHCLAATAPTHAVHHYDPHRVFTIHAWIPLAIVWVGGVVRFGGTPWMIYLSAVLAGFALYEGLHYRIHFARPLSSLESNLRNRHLMHHRYAPGTCFGVTSALWDLIFGTELEASRKARYRDEVAATPPLLGRSNLNRLLRLGIQARG
jgi:sterol desaturase/sphingolipid hydroxylase (fatty acid hydroxylase superfamily)